MLHVTDVLPWHGPPCDGMTLERGRHVHHACHLLDTDGLDESTVYPAWLGYVESWRMAKEVYGIEVVASELIVQHEGAGYLGRLDKTVMLKTMAGAGLGILDLKTGAPRPTVGPQTAAYERAFRESRLPASQRRSRMWRGVIQLHENGSVGSLTTERTQGQMLFTPADYSIFVSYLTIRRWEMSRGMWKPKERDD